MSFSKEDGIKLGNQLCFPLYACAKEIVKRYKPYLDEIDLTYTQYIVMMVLWEEREMNVKTLGEHLYLDSGTLTPVLKKLEAKAYIQRTRSREDERNVIVRITKQGEALKEKAYSVPVHMKKCLAISDEEAQSLYTMLYKVLHNLSTCNMEE